jgi:threonine/homoserine/homoserine lactone efflux protein
MNYDILPALMMFALVSSITPGPNNLMLMASGANFGFRRTLPHMLGVGIGFTLMVILVGVGIMQIFDLFPLSYDLLKYLSIGYLFFLAYKIATADTSFKNLKAKSKPMTFMQAVLFQWVNPKAWTMALTAISIYAPSKSFAAVCFVAFTFGIVNLPSVSSWAMLGQQIQKVLTSQNHFKLFNFTMASLLLLSLYPMINFL